MRFVEHQQKYMSEEVQQSEVIILKMLSRPLFMELEKEIHRPTLTKHPFFMKYYLADGVAFESICNTAVSVSTLSDRDALFSSGSKDDRIVFLSKGLLLYSTRSTSARELGVYSEPCSEDEESAVIEAGDWCCEPALWTLWHHLGMCWAGELSNVLAVDAERFCTVTVSQHLLTHETLMYANAFVGKLNEDAGCEGLSDLSFPRVMLAQLANAAFAASSFRRKGVERRNWKMWFLSGSAGSHASGESKGIDRVAVGASSSIIPTISIPPADKDTEIIWC
jgi:hypothetical protein